MQTLNDLLNSAHGRQFLESNGVCVTARAFTDRLDPPTNPNLANVLGASGKKLICSGQQLYVDYRQSVLSKIVAMQDLEEVEDLFPFFLWVDTDRSGSDSLTTKFAWPAPTKKGPVRITPPASRDIESRFVQLDETQLRSAIDKLGNELRRSKVSEKAAKERYEQLRALFVLNHTDTLSVFNQRLSEFLLESHLGYSPYAVVLSDVLNRGLITPDVNLFVSNVDEIVRVFNESIGTVAAQGVDPQVRPLDADYLPLFYSCDVDDRRLRLHHRVSGGEHFAVAECKCGRSYRFCLGKTALSIDDLAETNRWSPDVCFPMFLNDLVSGYVAGKSSGLYLIVMAMVLRTVLRTRPVPILIPENLGTSPKGAAGIDSLLCSYMSG